MIRRVKICAKIYNSKVMDGVLGPREAGRFITENSQDVSVGMEGVTKVANFLYEKLLKGSFGVKLWRTHELNPQSMDEKAIDWVFVSAVLNFSFWAPEQIESKKFCVFYKGKTYTGYWALCAAMNRALDEGIPVTTPSFYASVDRETLVKIFRSSTDIDIPLLEERHKALTEAGQVLMKKFQGTFANVIKEANKSAQSLLKIVLDNFSSFQDVAEYAGKKVGMYKRAQILIGDIWGCCEGQGHGQFDDIDSITMFADYRVPQALVYFNALRYSDSALEKLKKNVLLQNGEKLEVEIRGTSIWICELIRDEIVGLLKKNGKENDYSINSILIDHYLWDLRREMAEEMNDIPFHKCRCIYY